MKKHLQKSIEMDQEEDEELGDESGNTVPESLTDKEKFKETVKEIEKSSKNNRNKDKLRSSSLNLLKQAEKNPEKVLKKLNELEEKVKESLKDVIGINDPHARLMLNKKGKWGWDYNTQIIVDEYKVIIPISYLTQNSTDHFELIPSIEQSKINLEWIYNEMPSNFQFGADNGYFVDENTKYLEEKGLGGYISTIKLSRKEKMYNLWDKPFQKDNFTYDPEIETYMCPLGEILYWRRTYEYKNKPRITYWTNEYKNCIMKEICCKKMNYKTIQEYGNPSKIRMRRKMETEWAQKIYKRSKTVKLPFVHIKQNMKLQELTTIGIKNTNTEFILTQSDTI